MLPFNPTPDKLEQLRNIAVRDPYLSAQDKNLIEEQLASPNHLKNILQGVGGAAIGYMLSKFLNLSRTTQIILTIAGFGIGRALSDHLKKNNANLTTRINDLYVTKV